MIAWIITSSVLIAVVIVLRFLFRRKISSRLQYALWGLVMVKLLMPFSLFESPLSFMGLVPDSNISEKQVYVLPISNQPVDEISGVYVNSTGALIDTNSFGYSKISEDGATITRYVQKISVSQVFMFIWVVGSITVGLWFMGTNVLFYKRLRKTRKAYSSTDYNLPVYISEHISSPCLFGIRHPAVYLTPKTVEKEENIHYALMHELCHYQHGDHVWGILRCLCLTFWWWNPLVWAAAILSREDSELACDEAVIKLIGQENRLAYGHTLVDMVAVRNTPTDLMCAATMMASGKRSLKGRLNMIIKRPKTVIPAMAAVLLILGISAGSTFSSTDRKILNDPGQDFPAIQMVFHSFNTDFELIGRDAAEFYYTQLMKDDVSPYWHITKYDTLSCALTAGNETEFTVLVTSSIETEGAGFLVGQGIPRDPNDLSKGGICPQVERLFRIKAIDKGKYEIVSVGTGRGNQGLKPVENLPSYALFKLRNGEILSTISSLSGDNAKLAGDTIMNYMIKSAAWPGVDIKALGDCLLLRATHSDGRKTDYFAFKLDGNAVMQMGENGLYSRIDDQLYERLVKLMYSGAAPTTTGSLVSPGQISTADRTNLTTCLADAILRANANENKKSDFAAQANTVLKTIEKGNTTTVYGIALYTEFGYAGSGFFETGGSHMPVAITFERNAAGEYQLKEYWRPKDGSGYTPSIKDKFPSDIYREALNTQKYILAHTQACYEQAIQYGKVNTDVEIAKLIRTISSSPAYMSNPQAYIDAHPIEYRELTYYKNYTLRYCFNQFEKGEQTSLEGHIMAAVCRNIMGKEENLNILSNTGQDWYNAFKDSTLNLRQQFGDAYVEKNRPGSWLLLQML